METLAKYKKRQKTWGVLFLVSLVLTLLLVPLVGLLTFQSESSRSSSPPYIPSDSKAPESSPDYSSAPTPAATGSSNTISRTAGDTASNTAQSNVANTPLRRSAVNASNLSNRNSNVSPTVKPTGDATPAPVQTNQAANASRRSANNSSSNVGSTRTLPTPSSTTNSFNFQLPVTTSKFPIFILVTGGLTVFSTFVTMMGFLTTTVFAWKRERREKESFRIEKEKKELELQRLRIELEQTRQAASSEFKICPVCTRTYPDMATAYCLNDGALLAPSRNSKEFPSGSSDKTLIFDNEQPTRKM